MQKNVSISCFWPLNINYYAEKWMFCVLLTSKYQLWCRKIKVFHVILPLRDPPGTPPKVPLELSMPKSTILKKKKNKKTSENFMNFNPSMGSSQGTLLTSKYKLLCRKMKVFQTFDLNISIIMQKNKGFSCFWPQHIDYYAEKWRFVVLLTSEYQLLCRKMKVLHTFNLKI